jgi:hypothetical protein
MPRTITGLDVQENLSCEVLDIAQKVTILGETPTTKKFLAYNPPDDTTTYQDIDVADDIDITTLPEITTTIASDRMLIAHADGTNKKISPADVGVSYEASRGIVIDTSVTPNTISTNTDQSTISDLDIGSGARLAVLKVPHDITAGTNITLTGVKPGSGGYNGETTVSINSTDTQYTSGLAIQVNAGTLPTPTIDWKPDLTTLGFTGPYATCLKVPQQLVGSTNINMTSNYDGSGQVYISATDTNTEYTGGLGIEIIATDEINARTDGNTTSINTGNNTIEVLRVPNELQAGANIIMTADYDGSNVVSISATDTNTEYTGGTGIGISITDTINAQTDTILNTTSINGNNQIQVLKVPNELRQSNNIVMTNSLGNPIANFDGHTVVNISLEESPIIENLTITGGAGFNHIENMNIAFGNSTTPISGLNGFLFQNGITGNQLPFQLQGAAPGGFTNSGGGTTSTNGFNSLLSPEPTSRYFVFSGGSNPPPSNRWIRTRSIEYLIIQGGTIEAYYIQGNSSNGGENADGNEDLVFEVLDASFTTILPTVNVSLGATGYIGNLFSLFTYTLTASQASQGYYLQFRQIAHSGSAFDNYGIKYIRFNSGSSDVRILNLPTSAPTETGRIWNDNGILKIV